MNPDLQNQVSPQTLERVYQPLTRRTFLKGTAAAMAGVAGLVAALKPLLALERGELTLHDLLQKHYRELKPDDMQRILKALEEAGIGGIGAMGLLGEAGMDALEVWSIAHDGQIFPMLRSVRRSDAHNTSKVSENL